MTAQASDWKRLYQFAQLEKDAQKQTALCRQARRMMQDRSIALAQANACNAVEEDELNAALRELWKLQNRH